MNISSISINRPVLSVVLSILIVLFGVIGFLFLGVREYPSVDPPIVTVSTSYTGANADVMESQVTEPLEESINGIAGIRSLTSSSSDGRSRITVEFELGVDMEAAVNDVRDRVSRAAHDLPTDIDPPTISKADADASPMNTVPTGAPSSPPSGPAYPVTDSAYVDPVRFRAPIAIASATGSLTAPCSPSRAASTPSSSVFIRSV